MKGYKGMSKDMTCRGRKYKIGKTYHMSGQINVCRNGMHFCKRLEDVFEFYPDKDGNRFFEIEADGVIDTDGTKSAAETMIVTREVERKEIGRCKCGNGYGNGYGYGYGYGDGNGYGDGYGYDYGYGYGDGYDYGYGNGYDYGYGIQRILLFND